MMAPKPGPNLLLQALRRPETAPGLSMSEWDTLISQGGGVAVLGRLSCRLEASGVLGRLPPKVPQMLRAERARSEANRRSLLWELNRLKRALRGTDTKIVALKGSAYALANLPVARGRFCSDVDIMVPKSSLREVETALLENGWEATLEDAYDQRYYRTWMHELPPLLHKDRDTVVDVHHALSPETSRFRADSDAVLNAAIPVDDTGLCVLSPFDMVLHTATHFMQDPESVVMLRDLIDMDELLRYFGAPGEVSDSTEVSSGRRRSESGAAFWESLLRRARELRLTRPLFYASRYAKQVLGTPVPESVEETIATWGPVAPLTRLMDSLVWRVLTHSHPSRFRASARIASGSIYVRSHWLRMPPVLLAPHLVRKGWRRLFENREQAQAPGVL